jgi:hypothetical protein
MRSFFLFIIGVLFLFSTRRAEAQVKRFPLEKLSGTWQAKGTVIMEDCKGFVVPFYYDSLMQEYCLRMEDTANICGGIYMRCYMFYNESKKCYEALTVSGNKTYRMQGVVREGFLIFNANQPEGIMEMVIGMDAAANVWTMDSHLIDPNVGVIPMLNLQFTRMVRKR